MVRRAELLLLLSIFVGSGFGEPPDRIHGLIGQGLTGQGSIGNEAVIPLRGNTRAQATQATDLGPIGSSERLTGMKLVLRQTPEQAADLEQFLEEQRDPASTDYQNWLSPEEFGERFGVSQNDLNRLTEWLQSMGFSVDSTARARNWITFSGTAGQVGKAFHTELRHYFVDDEMHFANASEPSVPVALEGVIERIGGLDDFRPKPRQTRILRRGVTPNYTASSGVHYLAPDDLAAIYNFAPLLKAGIDGTGQKLVIAGQTDINLSDIRAFRAQFGLAAKDPQLVLVGTDPGVSPGDQIEADLDLEWSGAVARNATVVYVYSQDVFESIQYAIDQDLAPVISDSYGSCEAGSPTGFRSVAQQANAEGITWMNAAGDSGAAGCDYDTSVATHGPSVIFPADIPEVTAVGGTEFNENGSSGWSAQNGATLASATGYLPEKAWNDTALGQGIAAGGGGASAAFGKPWWQTGPGVPGDNARDVPDVALSASGAHDGYLIYANGSLIAVGGTSAASPSFAGIVTLVDHYLVAKAGQAKPGLGNINPNLYALAQISGAPLHDITVGDNIVPCLTASTGCSNGSFGYKAGVGYDLATGLGSVDAYNLAVKWHGASVESGTSLTLTASPASIVQTGTTQLTAIVSAVSGSAQPAGTVAFTSGTVSLGSAPVVVSGSSASATLTVKASSLVVGVNAIGATFTGNGSFAGSAATSSVTVTQPVVATSTALSAAPVAVLTNGTTTLTATVKPATGSTPPAGSVTFVFGSVTLARVPLVVSGTSGTAVFSLAGSKLQLGSNTIVADYTGTGNFSNSTASVSISVASPAISTAVSLTAAPASLLTTGSTVLLATVKPASGSASASGTVNFSLGTVTLGTATLATSGSSAQATLTVSASKLTLGPNAIVAAYAGSAAFASSTSAPVTVTVSAPAIATTLTVTASPATIATGGTTSVNVTVKAASGSSLPTGGVSFSRSGVALGTVNLSPAGTSATASLGVASTSLQTGTNSIVATYAGANGFAASSGTVAVLLSALPVSTTTVVTASPATLSPTGSTQITASVAPSSGTSVPPGTVAFTLGKTSLGTVTVAASAGASAAASITVKGSSLASGANTITAMFLPGGNFTGSAGSVTAILTSAQIATSSTVSAGSTLIAQNATTLLTFAVKAASGATLPSGTVTFTAGNVVLGTAALSTNGTIATATLSIKAANLPQKTNTVTATYGGNTAFAASSASISINVD